MKTLCKSQGSVLVGAVAFTLIMAIGGAGYLAVTGNTVNHEAAALDNERAFFAAESGLLIATRWLREQTNYSMIENLAKGNSLTILNWDQPGELLNNMTVKVDIEKTSDDIFTIRSEATGGILKYRKILSWAARKGGGETSMLIDDMSGMKTKGLANIIFDGRVHINNDFKFFAGIGNNPTFFNGPVTVTNSNTQWGNDQNGSPPYYNNFDWGIYEDNTEPGKLDIKVGNPNGIDAHFKTSYFHHKPKLTNTISWNTPSHLLDVKDPNNAFLLFLPEDSSSDVIFNDGQSANQEITFNDGDVFFVLNEQSIKVSGIVNGKCSVITQGAGNIIIEGNLVYDDWNWDVDGVIATGNGKNNTVFNFNFNDNYGLQHNENMISLICADNGNIVLNIPDDDPEYCMSGFFYTKDGMLDLSNAKQNIDVYFVGARSSKTINNEHWDPGNGIGAYLFDRRINNTTLAQTGISIETTCSSGSGQLLIVLDLEWKEENVKL